ncbi:hypothetical protein AAKU52_001246 [Pedobacter sp. CG_S7]|uniref:hypothetical protein n=1 Tax=Pedobacter sp. CG_S7 TaxID=3143930 RepID=UPI003398E282
MFKSIKTGVLALFLIGTAFYAHAQKKISQGIITYGVEYDLSPDQKSTLDVSSLPKENKLEFNGNFSKLGMEMGPTILTIIKDGGAENALLLIDIPIAQKQIATKMSKEDIDKQAGGIKYSDFKATGEKLMVSGYNTEKYTYKDDKGNAYELWATKDITLTPGASNSEFKDVKGTPIKFTLSQNSVKTILTIKSITEKNVGPFTLDVPSGYDLLTMAELEALRGGG